MGGSLGLHQVCVYFAFTFAIPTTIRSLIIRTEIRTTISERLKKKLFIQDLIFRSIIGRITNPSRGGFLVSSITIVQPLALVKNYQLLRMCIGRVW